MCHEISICDIYIRHTQHSVVVRLNILSYNLNRVSKVKERGIWNLETYITYSSISKTLYTRGILFINYPKTLYTHCTLFNRLITVSRYNKIVHFLIKNELQSPYIKDSLVKPQLILQVTPLPANNMTWYTHPTMIIEHVILFMS